MYIFTSANHLKVIFCDLVVSGSRFGGLFVKPLGSVTCDLCDRQIAQHNLLLRLLVIV